MLNLPTMTTDDFVQAGECPSELATELAAAKAELLAARKNGGKCRCEQRRYDAALAAVSRLIPRKQEHEIVTEPVEIDDGAGLQEWLERREGN